MPELPEVEMARMFALEKARGRTIAMVEVLDRKMLEGGTLKGMVDGSVGRELMDARRHGKHLFLDIGNGCIHVHLGMSGSLRWRSVDEKACKHERLSLVMNNGALVLDDPRRFGRFGLVGSVNDLVRMKRLGPDALTISLDDFVVRARRRGAIKPMLLDQSVVAGIGNLYADESLFQVGLHPSTQIRYIRDDELEELGRTFKRVLRASIDCGTDFDLLPSTYLLRQREIGRPCPLCASRLESTTVGGRTSIFCPRCQRLS